MSDNFNQLTPAETERLALLAEECSEVIHVIGKILRHGYSSTNPKKKDYRTNRTMLGDEIGDVMAAISIMQDQGDIPSNPVLEAYAAMKLGKVEKYLHHNIIKNPK